MDFFADGGFQQLFCDLNEQIEQDYNSWQQLTTNTGNNNCNNSNKTSNGNNNKSDCNNNNYYSSSNNHNYNNNNNKGNYNAANNNSNNNNIIDIPPQETDIRNSLNQNCPTSQNETIYTTEMFNLNEKNLQNSLDYILQNSCDSPEYDDLSTLNGGCLSKDLCDWEYNFLDNFIEIPELVDILPEKTPLCTDVCNHFLQESAENLKLSCSGPSSPAANDKSYACTFGECRKIYAKPAHLKAHLRRHLGEKPYVCIWPNCTWRFSRSDELARHRRSHSGVKPYKCDFCAKCFARSDHLTKHRKVHERRLLAASKAGKHLLNGELPPSVLTVRPGRKRKNQF